MPWAWSRLECLQWWTVTPVISIHCDWPSFDFSSWNFGILNPKRWKTWRLEGAWVGEAFRFKGSISDTESIVDQHTSECRILGPIRHSRQCWTLNSRLRQGVDHRVHAFTSWSECPIQPGIRHSEGLFQSWVWVSDFSCSFFGGCFQELIVIVFWRPHCCLWKVVYKPLIDNNMECWLSCLRVEVESVGFMLQETVGFSGPRVSRFWLVCWELWLLWWYSKKSIVWPPLTVSSFFAMESICACFFPDTPVHCCS